MKKYSVFDIMGPIMVGPSSSHTAGAARLGRMARGLCGGEITKVNFLLHGSFGQTFRGHGTDKALLAGILGIGSGDYRLRDAFELAQKQNIHWTFTPTELGDVHPNTVRFLITTKNGRQVEVQGSSVGGGSVVITEIDGIQVWFTGEKPILVTKHRDEPGVVAGITSLLYRRNINIGNMRVNRLESANQAAMYIELDGTAGSALEREIREIPGLEYAMLLDMAAD